MAYPPRPCFEGAVYHVTVRGDNREPTFLGDADYCHYLGLLRRYKEQFRFTLYAYALMPNHVHLILEPSTGSTISRIMQSLSIAYTRYFNERYHRVGHVFQGRFHSRLIDKDNYLLVATRYVHRNPVRAKLSQRAEQYPWSSYLAYVDPRADGWRLADASLPLALAAPGLGAIEQQRREYRTLTETPIPADLADRI